LITENKRILLKLCDMRSATSRDLAKSLGMNVHDVARCLSMYRHCWCDIVRMKLIKYPHGETYSLPVWRSIRKRSMIEHSRTLSRKC
jgi:hypothetical protein